VDRSLMRIWHDEAMLHDQFLAALGRDGMAFLGACSAVPADMVIESCPGWRPPDLLWHLADVHHFWSSVVELRATTLDQVPSRERPDDAELPGIFRSGLRHLLDVLTSADPATEVWTWSGQHDVAFVVRRMAHETSMHRWDADHAAGRAAAIDGELASDGIDEFLSHFLRFHHEGAVLDGSVHLHCTDVAGEWTTRPTADGLVTTREHSKGDCALRGSADLLLRALWRRASITDIEVIGDAVVAGQFLAYTNLA
jgi:uncharacterized protein (TIGR03083 family)